MDQMWSDRVRVPTCVCAVVPGLHALSHEVVASALGVILPT